jgi:hypothetical protein
MTASDWVGVAIALISAGGMAAAYVLVFNPANKASLEIHRDMVLDDDPPATPEKQR